MFSCFRDYFFTQQINLVYKYGAESKYLEMVDLFINHNSAK